MLILICGDTVHRFHDNLVHLDMSKPFESTVHAVAVGRQINNLF